MNRSWVAAGSCLAAVLLIGTGHLYLGEETRPELPTSAKAGPKPQTPAPAGQKRPAPSQAETFAQLAELARTGPLTPDLPAGLRKTGGRKAIDPILSVLRSTDDWKVVGACAIELQSYRDPGLLQDILTRLDSLGILDSPGKLPWFSKSLLAAYLRDAPDPLPGLRAARSRPSLVPANLEVVRRALEGPDAETRRVAAEAVRKAVVGKHLDPREGEALLAGQLERESEPVLKAQITGGLAEVRDFLKQLESTK